MIQSLFFGVVFLPWRWDQTTWQVFNFILSIETYENCNIKIAVIIISMFKNFFIYIVYSINLNISLLNDSIVRVFLVHAVYFISKLDFFTCGFFPSEVFPIGRALGWWVGKTFQI